MVAAFTNLEPEKMVEVMARFLSKESAGLLFDIKFTKIGNDGNEVELAYTLEQRLKKILIASIGGMMGLLDLLLSIQGMTKKQIDALFLAEQKEVSHKNRGKKKKVTPTRG